MKTPLASDREEGWYARVRVLRRVYPSLRMAWHAGPWHAVIAIVLRLVIASLPICRLWIAKMIIDSLLSFTGRSVNFSLLLPLVSLELVCIVLLDVSTRSLAFIDSLLNDRFTHALSISIMQHAATLDLASFEDPSFHDKLDRARQHTNSRFAMLTVVANMTQQLLALLTYVALLAVRIPWVLPLLIVAFIPPFLGETHFARLSYSMLYVRTSQRRGLDYLRYLGSSADCAKEVSLFGLARHLIQRTDELFREFYEENKMLATRRCIRGGLLALVPVVAYFGAYLLILYDAASRSISIGVLTLCAGALANSRALIEGLFAQLASVSEQMLYFNDLVEFFATRPSIASPEAPKHIAHPIERGIEFRRVSFAYPGATSNVLDKVSFSVAKGTRVALIGDNGAGKTTVVKLLARLYDPSEGEILLDGRDIREYDLDELRREIGIIFQDYLRYDLTIRENIGFGRIERHDDLNRIQCAAEKSCADRVVAGLQYGYYQMLGHRFEGGVDLSTGQWQKVALARAYMRDAQILVLDEPTASLDARAEFEVYQQFAGLTEDRIAVLISHRFSTVRMADRILVLSEGHISEQGTHQELLKLGGEYAEMFELQAAGYR
jgi:ATP-binding cassette subfamily B protein